MKRELYIHIGGHKTGTSAIQTFLSLNRNLLKTKGVLYPGKRLAHHDLAREFRNASLEHIRRENPKPLGYLHEITRGGYPKSILSSEGFEGPKIAVNTLRDVIPDDYEVKIIFYVRRQDERLESGYNQHVKGLRIRDTKKFSSGMAFTRLHNKDGKGIPAFLDYYRVLSPWRETFGKENIIVRCYEKEQMPDGIFKDFCTVIGLDLEPEYKIPDGRVNPSLDWNTIEIIRLCNEQFSDDRRFHRWLIRALNKINKADPSRKQYLLSPQQRRDLIERCAESNEKVAREYLGREDGVLFYAPLPEPDEPWQPYGGLTVENFVPIFTQLCYHVDTRNRGLNNNFFYRVYQKLKNNRGS